MYRLRHRIRHLVVSSMLAAMMAFVAHGLVLGAHMAAAHGHSFVSSHAADHAQEPGAVSPHQTAGDLAIVDGLDEPERSTHAHCPSCCAGTCAVALPAVTIAFNLWPIRISVMGLDREAGHGIDPDNPRRPPRTPPMA